MSLRWRIALPLGALLITLLIAVTVVSADRVSRAVERRLTSQAERLARLVKPFPSWDRSSRLLGRFREAFDAEIVIVHQGSMYGTTNQLSDLEGISRSDLKGKLTPVGPWLVAWSPITDDRELFLLYDPKIVDEERGGSVGSVLTVGIAGVVLVIVLAFVITLSIARPVERLSAAARRVADGDLEVDIPSVRGATEIDRLVETFRQMLDGLRSYRDDLVKSERMAVLGQMAAGIAHEIRNPLSAMKMTVQMLQEESADKEPYDIVLREIERLDLAVSELFNAANPTRLQKEDVGLSDLAEEVLTLLRPQLDHLSVSLDRKFQSQARVSVDRNVFKRAIMNLVLNGAQSMPRGGSLEVGTSGSNGRVEFFVRDKGGGIPDDMKDRLFEPFHTSKEGGVGLGLAVTKRIVEDHGGSIGYDSSKDGSVFWIRLHG